MSRGSPAQTGKATFVSLVEFLEIWVWVCTISRWVGICPYGSLILECNAGVIQTTTFCWHNFLLLRKCIENITMVMRGPLTWWRQRAHGFLWEWGHLLRVWLSSWFFNDSLQILGDGRAIRGWGSAFPWLTQTSQGGWPMKTAGVPGLGSSPRVH